MEYDEVCKRLENDPELLTFVNHILTENYELKKYCASLEARIAELERQINQNSKNSSRPPSTDGFKRVTKKREKGKNPPGGQKGHKGHTLEFTQNPDFIEVHRPSICEGCGMSLDGVKPIAVEKRQVSDVPPPVIYVTEHVGESVICPHCGQYHAAPFPTHVTRPLQYGPFIRALMVYLCMYQLIPYDRTAEFFSDVYGRGPSKGTIIKACSDCSKNLVDVEEKIKEQLLKKHVLHADETGMQINGKREWLHTVSDENLTFYAHHEKRGSVAIDEMGIIPEFSGVLVHDCWNPYFRYSCTHALCNAHLLRELEGISENCEQKWSDMMQDLLNEILEEVHDTSKTATSLSPERIREYEERYDAVLKMGDKENPISTNPEQKNKRGPPKKTKSQNLIARFKLHKENILRFMKDFRVPFTNNQAERDVRMVKVQQKISGTFRSTEGASNFCRIRGYISTVKKNGVPVLESIRGAFVGNPFTPTEV